MFSYNGKKRAYKALKTAAVFGVSIFTVTAAFVLYLGIRDNNTTFIILPFCIVALSSLVSWILYHYASISFLSVGFEDDKAAFIMSDDKTVKIPCANFYYVRDSDFMRRIVLKYKKDGKKKTLIYDKRLMYPGKEALNVYELKRRLTNARFVTD